MIATGNCCPYPRVITEIQINSQPCKGINLTTWHTQAWGHREWQQFMMYTSTDTLWVAWILSHCTPVKRGKVSSNSLTNEATQFRDSICLVCMSTQLKLGALNIKSDHSPSFPSNILHFFLIAPPGLELYQPFDHLAKPHRTSIIRKWPYHEWIPTTHLLPIAYPTKHSILSLCIFHRGKQSGLVRVFLVQLGFHQTPILKCTVRA
jgi:hypothetical protein